MESDLRQKVYSYFSREVYKKLLNFTDILENQSRASEGGKIILAHLALEKVLDEFIMEQNKIHFNINDLQIGFSKKIEISKKTIVSVLCQARDLTSDVLFKIGRDLKSIEILIENFNNINEVNLFHTLRALNRIRNKYAHNLRIEDINASDINILKKHIKASKYMSKDKKVPDKVDEMFQIAALDCADELYTLLLMSGLMDILTEPFKLDNYNR